jgi:hypothetical protein
MSINTVWKAQDSPYYLTGDLTVAPGVSLVIDKGVTVNVSSAEQWDAESADDLVELRVQGTLMIQGTADQPVVMTSSSGAPAAGDWQGIIFDVAADLGASLIKRPASVVCEYGLDGLSGLPQITASRLINCRVAGVRSSSSRSDLLIENNYFDSCASGLLVQDNNVITSHLPVIRWFGAYMALSVATNKYAKASSIRLAFLV